VAEYTREKTTDDILAGLAKTYSLVQQIGWINPNPMSIILEATDSGAKKLLAQTGQTEGHAFHQSFSTVTYQGVDFNGIVCLYPREIDKVGKRLKGILPISIHTLTTLTHEFSHAFGTTVPGASVISSDERSAVELLTDSISYQANAGTNMHKNLFYAFNYLFEEAKSKGIDFTNSAYDTLSKSVIAKNKK